MGDFEKASLKQTAEMYAERAEAIRDQDPRTSNYFRALAANYYRYAEDENA